VAVTYLFPRWPENTGGYTVGDLWETGFDPLNPPNDFSFRFGVWSSFGGVKNHTLLMNPNVFVIGAGEPLEPSGWSASASRPLEGAGPLRVSLWPKAHFSFPGPAPSFTGTMSAVFGVTLDNGWSISMRHELSGSGDAVDEVGRWQPADPNYLIVLTVYDPDTGYSEHVIYDGEIDGDTIPWTADTWPTETTVSVPSFILDLTPAGLRLQHLDEPLTIGGSGRGYLYDETFPVGGATAYTGFAISGQASYEWDETDTAPVMVQPIPWIYLVGFVPVGGRLPLRVMQRGDGAAGGTARWALGSARCATTGNRANGVQ
jgi:hypothetical protein